jgi:thymidylate synthase (FAD)
MGDDLTVVNSARVSFNKESSEVSEKDIKLIKYLAKNGHWTPFSHPQICLRETVPIFVARQRFKHSIGFSYNEVSRRYVNDPPEFYTPDKWRKRADNVKQGSSDEAIENIWFHNNVEGWEDSLDNLYQQHIETSQQLYQSMIEGGVAPEQARGWFFLSLCILATM